MAREACSAGPRPFSGPDYVSLTGSLLDYLPYDGMGQEGQSAQTGTVCS